MKENTITPEKNEILLLSSYPSRECGIATFSQDLVNALTKTVSKSFTTSVCALEREGTKASYPSEVKYKLNCDVQAEYYFVAKEINENDNIRAVVIEHEFGLFGGENGDWILGFLFVINKPVIVTFHTVLPNPEEKRKMLVKRIVEASEATIVMTNNSSKIMLEDYKIPADKLHIIPHGTHPVEQKNKSQLKIKNGYNNRMIATTFGLLSANKNIESAFDALPAIVQKYPEFLYLVVGKTHPEVVKHSGEIYRNYLERKVIDLGLEKNVQFINSYKTLDEILEILQMSDFYLFTSKDRNQAVSGTFAYALSCGCPIIATGIPHAKEVLCPNTGILIDFENPVQLTNAIRCLLENKAVRENMSKNAIHKSKESEWQNVALKHAFLLEEYLTKKTLQFNLPPISLKHISKLTKEYGIVQFSKINTPDVTSGYTLDDNARALIAVTMEYELSRDSSNFILMDKYLRFIGTCQKNNGLFSNYIDEFGYHHEQNKTENLEDSNGRAIWALGTIVANKKILPSTFVARAELYLNQILPWMTELNSPRAIAFCIKGLYLYNTERKDGNIRFLIHFLASKLEERHYLVKDNQWYWFENYMTYGNSVLPEAMLLAHLSTENMHFKNIAKTCLDFLLSHIFIEGKIKVISNNGWMHKDEKRNMVGGEQPIDVAYTVQTLHLFYNAFKDDSYRNKMEVAFSWFLGNNHLKQTIYNPLTGGCHDGLERTNVNLNQGAESSVCYQMARISMEKVRTGIPAVPITARETQQYARPKEAIKMNVTLLN